MSGNPRPLIQRPSFVVVAEPMARHACNFCAVGLGSLLNSSDFLGYHDEGRRGWKSLVLNVHDCHGVQIGCLPISVAQDLTGVNVSSHVGTVFAGLRTSSYEANQIRDAYLAVMGFVRERLNGRAMEIRLPPELVASETATHLWALWSLGFHAEVTYLGRAFRLPTEAEASRLRRRGMSRAIQGGAEVLETRQVSQHVYQVLEENRMLRHGVQPLHSLDDLDVISRRVPGLVRVFQADHNDHLCAGAILFVHAKYATLQYLFRSQCSESSAMQDLALIRSTEAVATETPWLLLGTSTEPDENHRAINTGLDAYKRSWGSIPYTAYRMKRQLGDVTPLPPYG